jgi:hypothetical protein
VGREYYHNTCDALFRQVANALASVAAAARRLVEPPCCYRGFESLPHQQLWENRC